MSVHFGYENMYRKDDSETHHNTAMHGKSPRSRQVQVKTRKIGIKKHWWGAERNTQYDSITTAAIVFYTTQLLTAFHTYI